MAPLFVRKNMIIKVEEENIGLRLDQFLSQKIEQYSRNQIKKSILQGLVKKEGETLEPDYHIQVNDIFTFEPPIIESSNLKPEKIDLDIIYEDQKVLVVNKKVGMVMHPGAGNWEGTLANAVLGRLKKQSDILKTPLRAGIVHRLDKDTSGIVVVAKDDQTLEFLQRQFREKITVKKYYALVLGKPTSDEGIINAPIGRHRGFRKKFTILENGKEAITHYKVLETFSSFSVTNDSIFISLLEVSPKTGRTHQIRVHLSKLGYPILGDQVYGREQTRISKSLGIKRQMLHAYYLKINLPEIGEKEFQIEIPKDMEEVISRFKSQIRK